MMVRHDKLEKDIALQKQTCKDNTSSTNDHLDQIALNYKEDIVDIKALSDGFSRELERMQILFRELQSEFLVTLEDKRQGNETLMRGLDVKLNQIESFKNKSKQESQRNLSLLLPKLKRSHELSNANLQTRQGKIISILKGEGLDTLTDKKSRRHLGSDMKS